MNEDTVMVFIEKVKDQWRKVEFQLRAILL